MPGITPEPVMKIAMGFMAAKFLFAANEIGLFEALATGPASLRELATRIAVPSRTTTAISPGTRANAHRNHRRRNFQSSTSPRS